MTSGEEMCAKLSFCLTHLCFPGTGRGVRFRLFTPFHLSISLPPPPPPSCFSLSAFIVSFPSTVLQSQAAVSTALGVTSV